MNGSSNGSLGIVNWIILVLCGFLFAASQATTPQWEPIPSQFPAFALFSSPLKNSLLFDYPHAFTYLEQVMNTYGVEGLQDPYALPQTGQQLISKYLHTPFWTGLYDKVTAYFLGEKPSFAAPLFEKIRQGEVWRLFTPALLHADLMHIAFNMIWLVIIGKQVEKRLGIARYLLLIILAALVSNTAQYLMSGPNFVGFSGVVCALITFVWVRQKIAPWEGYFMQPSTFNFIALFVILMCTLQLLSFLMEITLQKSIPVTIANSAHLAGALVGYLLGRLSFFRSGYN